jgi:peptidoglycan hydrolase CwlO-like protein
LHTVFGLILVLAGIVTYQIHVRADELQDITKQLDDLQHQLELSVSATTPLEAEVAKLNARLTSIQSQITVAESKTKKLAADIAEREKQIATQYTILSAKVRDYYKKSRLYSPLLTLVSSRTATELSRGIMYRAATADEDKDTIVAVTQVVMQLEADKKKVEADKAQLATLQTKLDSQRDFFAHEIAGAKKWQQELSSKIAVLSARQQQILSEKSGTFQTTVGDVPLADDPASRPDYNPGFSPAFAAFSFGAPHFKGMSQYGALGRAKSGQSAEQILRAYYGNDIEIKKEYDAGKQIGVAGYGRMSIETYVKRIYEVPNSWGDQGGMEALKAQAVAARSYALAWTREGTGGNICTDEGCQVYKNADKGGNWNAAAEATRGWVIYKNGKILSSWYASTSGGYQESYDALAYLKDGSSYTTPSFWDTPSGQGGWTAQAYEKTAGSPWFYKAWYRDRGGDACGRSHPWLSSEEMADILNAWVVLFSGGGDASRVTPEGGCWGGSPYSKDELRGIGGYSSVSGVSVSYAGNGVTANVTFQTNKGSVTVNGADFKKTFNLRAPGKISLKSGLFNIEKK